MHVMYIYLTTRFINGFISGENISVKIKIIGWCI